MVVCCMFWYQSFGEVIPYVSGVPQGTVLCPLMFSLHINDITADIKSEIRLVAVLAIVKLRT